MYGICLVTVLPPYIYIYAYIYTYIYLGSAVETRTLIYYYIYIFDTSDIQYFCTLHFQQSMCDQWAYRHGIISHHSVMMYLRDIYSHIYHVLKIHSCNEDDLQSRSESNSENQIIKK